MNPTERAMQHVCDQWRTATVIPFPTQSQRMERQSRQWMRTYTRPFVPQDPRPAA